MTGIFQVNNEDQANCMKCRHVLVCRRHLISPGFRNSRIYGIIAPACKDFWDLDDVTDCILKEPNPFWLAYK
jgi:hypothetical protein